MKWKLILTVCAAISLLVLATGCGRLFGKRPVIILVPREASFHEKLAALEIRRYIYLRTGTLLKILEENPEIPEKADLILTAQKDRPIVQDLSKTLKLGTLLDIINPEHYLLKTVEQGRRRVLLVTSGDGLGVLYGAYRFAERLGVRFYLHGDVIPDSKIKWSLPDLNEDEQPLFAIRGIQPFHDFPEGPDWWNLDDYKAVVAQLPKLGMNFFGLHCYPEGSVGPEPSVWIGLGEDTSTGGEVTFGYPSRYFTTLEGGWGYAPKNTGDYLFGSRELFETDAYGPEVMNGASPLPDTPDKSIEVFNRTGELLRESFSFARRLGIKTCVGTETPLTIPEKVARRLREKNMNPSDMATVRRLYEGMFRRISNAYDINYYWFWTPEDWTWGGNTTRDVEAVTRDLGTAIEAAETVEAQFTIATCGWVLGPQSDRALFDRTLPAEMPMSCINRYLGMSPVDPAFKDIGGRPKWAIPWLEDDPSLTAPQLWAGRMRADAVEAHNDGCTGLIGIHWRTRNLGPTVAALAQASWVQRHLKPKTYTFGPLGENVDEFTQSLNAVGRPISGTENDILYQTVRHELSGYILDVPPGVYTVTLKFCETNYDKPGIRVFDVNIQGNPALTDFDIAAHAGKDTALDCTFEKIIVLKGGLRLDFVRKRDYPILAALEVESNKFSLKINCGGPAYKDYRADWDRAQSRDYDVADFYDDWALTQFGPETSADISRIFQAIDGCLPRPAQWTNGPGGLRPDPRPWDEVAPEYTFVSDMEKIRPRIRGVGNIERFDWWLNNFIYMRNLARLKCAWGRFDVAMAAVNAVSDPAARKDAAKRTALPLFTEMAGLAREVMTSLLGAVSTNGELGTVANLNQHAFPNVFDEAGKALREALGDDWTGIADLFAQNYTGTPRLIVPTVRTLAAPGETLNLKAIILAAQLPESAEVFWRPFGGTTFERAPLDHVNRGVYRVTFPAGGLSDDIEYYVKAVASDGAELVFPATAPENCQTVVVMPKE